MWTPLGSNIHGQGAKLLTMQTEKCVERGMHNAIGSDKVMWLTEGNMVI